MSLLWALTLSTELLGSEAKAGPVCLEACGLWSWCSHDHSVRWGKGLMWLTVPLGLAFYN